MGFWTDFFNGCKSPGSGWSQELFDLHAEYIQDMRERHKKDSLKEAEIFVDKLLKQSEQYKFEQLKKRKEKIKNPQSIYLRKRVSKY